MSAARTRNLGSVTRATAEYLRAAMTGAAPALPTSRGRYLWTVCGALRPHFFFLPGGAALVGAAAVGGEVRREVWGVAVAAALGWGVGQLVNDLLDVDADRVDAPGRPAPRGLLPEGPTLLLALGLGLVVLAVTVLSAPRGVWLVPAAVGLLLCYNVAKGWPLVGNVAHGALIAVAALLGALAQSGAGIGGALEHSAGALAYAGVVAATYLQANYEKDMTGDGRAGYRTLAHVLGPRASAGLRLISSGVLCLVALAAPWLQAPLARGLALGGALAVALSALGVVRLGRPTAAFRGYGLAVCGAAAMMLAPALGWLGPSFGGVVAVVLVLVVRAFARESNP
ncbi:MAG: UbiA family prenyltransferase [Polyangiaceae bacterium]|nr:UbiA family prenyltransferase [Polyangiaceae bacterium]